MLGQLLLGLLLVTQLGSGSSAATGPATVLPRASATSELEDDAALGELPPRHREFLEQVAFLITERERDVFLQLTADYRRDAFIRRFWRTRDPFPETPRNELEEQLAEFQQQAADRFEDAEDPRRKTFVLHGPAQRTFRSSCELLRPLEIWYYRSSPASRNEFFAVFVRFGGRHQLWSPDDGLGAILLRGSPLDLNAALSNIAETCTRGEDIVTALALSPNWETLDEQLPQVNDEWALAFLNSSVEVGEETERLDLSVDFPARHQSRTVVRAALELDAGALERHRAGGRETYNLLLDGEVVLGDELFETFRYRFDLPSSSTETADASIPLVIERYLRPGRYQLNVRLEDLNAKRLWQSTEDLEVPIISRTPDSSETMPRLDDEESTASTAGLSVDATTADLAASQPLVRLRVPNQELLVGRARVEAVTEGQGIARVSFELDGQFILSKRRPPYDVEVDLGRAPRLRQLVARALDAEGKEIATDQVAINAGPHSFAVRLVEPRRGGNYADSVRAIAEVDVPPLEKLDRVEFFFNETKLATLYQPPFVQAIKIPSDLPLSYVRVQGYLQNGGAAEDLVFVNAPEDIEYVDVDFVELYVTVQDRKRKLVEDLTVEDFRVLEDGHEQNVRRFELVRDIPVHACVLLDTSTSMDDRIGEAEDAALHFFQTVLTERDRACLVTFNDHHDLVVGFTNSAEILAGGLVELEPEGETALYDSLIHTLFYFNGLRGKRALILLSDGADSSSEYRFDEVLEFARRSTVQIYSIGLAIDHREMDTRSKLSRLAAETGGESYFIDSASELKRIYSQIEQELRSQYLLAYQSTSDAPADEFRPIEIKLERSGLKARTIKGYFP